MIININLLDVYNANSKHTLKTIFLDIGININKNKKRATWVYQQEQKNFVNKSSTKKPMIQKLRNN